MPKVKEIGLSDVIQELPDITQLNCKKDLIEKQYDVFLCALGFEERSLSIPERLADVKDFRCKEAVYFEYSTNVEDNFINKPRLIDALQKFSETTPRSFSCDIEGFTNKLRGFLKSRISKNCMPNILYDISVCSSNLLLLSVKALLEFDLYFHVVYSEAAVYHPTCGEFESNPAKWITEEGFGIAKGIGKIIRNQEYSGDQKDKLPDLVVAFPTFKPERTKSIIQDVDEALGVRPDDRIIWIIGDPHMDAAIKQKRKEMTRKINSISSNSPSYEVSTLNYKETMKVLEQIYRQKAMDFHINISALGSKMQTLGIALYHYIRPDITVISAMPKQYNPSQYSDGCKETWQINFEDSKNVRSVLDAVGQLETIN